VVVGGRELHDPVPQPDAAGPLAGGGQERLRRRGVAVLLEEVVLDLPAVVDAQAVGQLDLLEGVFQKAVLVVRRPRPRQWELIEQRDFHFVTFRCESTERSMVVTVSSLDLMPFAMCLAAT
jgi:hypothetical protein